MIKKEMIAMLLAGGQGSRLGVLTAKVAKPAVSFGGKYRIIDFPLSNCINSGVDTVGVLTQYQPLRLNTHIGIGMPWDLDRNVGGVTILPPYEKSTNSEWYTGTANAVYQNLDYIDTYNPDYVLILSGDHIYKMDYEVMLDFHKENNADVTIAVMPVPMEEASRFGIMITDEDNRITEFEEKPEHPRSNLASMGIYIFSWPILRNALIQLSSQPGCDFGKHIIPYCQENGIDFWAYMVLEQGALSGKYDIRHPLPAGSQRGETYNPMLPQIEKLVTVMRCIGEKYSVTPAQVALAWAIAKGTTPIIGVTKVSQVQDAVKAMRISLTTEEINQMETAAEETGVDTRGSWEMPMI